MYIIIYIIMYILNIASAIKKWHSMKSETLSLKTIIKELDFLKKIYYSKKHQKKISAIAGN